MNISTATQPGQVAAFHEIKLQWRKKLVQGKFYAEGEQVICRLLQSSVEILSMLMTPEYLEQWKDVIALRKDSIGTIWITEKNWMERNTGQKLNQGCLAIGRIPEPPPLQSFLDAGSCCFLALDGLDHAVNVGAIVRNGAAFGVSAIFVDRSTVHPYSWRSIRTSLGGIFHVPVCVVDCLKQCLSGLKTQGIKVIAADPNGAISIGEIDFSKHSCLLFGNEHRGISKELLSLATARVAIPVSANLDSLNVAAASAIFLHYAHKAKAFALQQSQKAP